MAVLIKKLAANELGHTQGHQAGGILVPRRCIGFFPALADGQNPEMNIDVRYQGEVIRLRFIHYNNAHWDPEGTRNEYRLTPIPRDLLRDVNPGDVFRLSTGEDGIHTIDVLASGSQQGTELLGLLGTAAGVVVDEGPEQQEAGNLPANQAAIRVERVGQGFIANAELRRRIEMAAMVSATEYFENQGFTVEDVSARMPFDLYCRRGCEALHVEVKGTTGRGDKIILTSGEIRFARDHADSMALYVLSGIIMNDGQAEGGNRRVIVPWLLDENLLEPMSYWYRLD